MSCSAIYACDPIRNPNKDILLNDILSYLYRFRNLKTTDEISKTINEIINGVQDQHPQYSNEQIQNGVIRGTRQGLFSKICTTEIPPFGTTFENRYEFNRNAPSVNVKNWCYMCPGADTMRPGICCSKPCLRTKGSFTTTERNCFVEGVAGGNQPRPERISIPGVPGSFERISIQNPCQTAQEIVTTATNVETNIQIKCGSRNQ